FYAGLWAAGVEFDDPDNTSVEGDLYAGRNFDLGSTRVSLEALYTFFPDTSTPGPTYDFLQLKVRVARSLRPFTLGALSAWTPEGSYASGTAWRVVLDAAYDIDKRLKVTANVGRRWIQRGVDRSFWDLGLTASGKHLSLDVRYVDTNLAIDECTFGKCSAAAVATVMWRF
ncbi:MAG: TorF family putative porin, partial [Steroidobacteraceae bacterium]